MTRRPTIRRFLKTSSALVVGQLVAILSQIVLPPAFLRHYGVNTYGEWLALSSGAAWLVTLDFGLQAFVVNQLSIEFFQGNIRRLKELQSVGLRISLGVVLCGFFLACGLLYLVPINRLLHLSLSRKESSLIAFCLALQTLMGIIWGQLNGTLRAVGYPHRAELWGQAQRVLYIIATFLCVLYQLPLWTIPIGQLLSFVLLTAVSLVDLKRCAPEAFPTLSYWDSATAHTVLKPSLWFGSFTLNQFLLFEVPILALNQASGTEAVVLFSLSRTYFGIVRQSLNVVRFALRPEITRLVGLGNWPRLSRIYEIYEGFSFTWAIITSALSFSVAPLIMTFWTQEPGMFVLSLYVAMMLATIVTSAKDVRLDLQYATNRHVRSAVICLVTYVGFALVAVPVARGWSATGIAALWAVTDLAQLMLLQRENQALLSSVSQWGIVKLCVSGILAAEMMQFLVDHFSAGPARTFAFVLSCTIIGLTIAVSYVFGLARKGKNLWLEIGGQLEKRAVLRPLNLAE